ncbi:MAG: hypothetical protein QOI15_2153 [Pseudonocardiales bacterium]|nr:hypothetical protein [Pseudonocardiales bacterium]
MNDTSTQSDRRRTGRARWVPFAASVTAAALTAGAIATAGGGAAGAAQAPNAQSAGNFLDATIGGNPIDDIAKLAFARAQNPGSVTDQNPLDVTVLNTINLPLTGALQLPQLLGITLGAANQVALARSSGQSYGAAGAVLNSGGVSVGGNNASKPANATIDLTAEGIAGNSPVPIPGGGDGTAAALGGITASIGAVSSIARTPEFGPALAHSWLQSCAADAATCYQIASVDLQLGSPLLGGILGSVTGLLDSVLGGLATAAGALNLPAACSFSADLGEISLENGAVVISAADASITIHLRNLVETLLGKDLNELPANFDLIGFLLDYLSSPDGLAAGLQGIISGLTDPLSNKFTACLTALGNNGPIGQVVGLLLQLTNALNAGKTQLTNLINSIVTALGNAAGGTSPLAPLADVLKKVIDIGVNVQPQVASGDFNTNLDRLPKQGMTPPPVPYEHTVRAIEVQLLGGGVTLALANSSAGPSNPGIIVCAQPPPTCGPPTSAPPTDIPTGVPAGMGTTGGSPLLPIVLLALGVLFAGGGVLSYRMRGSLNRH